MTTACDFLAAVQQRADAATDGPWEGEEFSNAIVAPAIGLSDDGVRHSGVAEDVYTLEDREFIAASRTDVPRLVAALTAALDLADGWAKHGNAQQKSQGKRVIAVITDALTPKENDS